MKYFTLIFVIAFNAAHAATIYKVSSGAKARFEASGKPSLMKIRGEGAEVTGELQLGDSTATGKFELTLNQFDTGIGLRDRHMKEKYLETEKFPRAILEVKEVALPKGFQPGTDIKDAAFKGLLTLKGVTKPVSGTLNVHGKELAINAKFQFSLADFPIGVPTYMGITVADQVSVSADLPKLERK